MKITNEKEYKAAYQEILRLEKSKDMPWATREERIVHVTEDEMKRIMELEEAMDAYDEAELASDLFDRDAEEREYRDNNEDYGSNDLWCRPEGF